MKNIIVFFGGKSCEHDISIITGVQVINSLDVQKYNVFPVYIGKSGKWFFDKNFRKVEQFVDFDENQKNVFLVAGDNNLYANKLITKKITQVDCAIICCHGMNGEDGTLQGILELSGIAYTSSNVLGSAVCMDKIFMKQIFEVNNLPVVPYSWFLKTEYEADEKKVLKNIQKDLDFPMLVKPANLGSSIGITKCENELDLIKGIEIAKCYDTRIVVEEVVPHLREINCAGLGNGENVEISNLEEPISWQKFLSFEQKYLNYTNTKIEMKKTADISKSIKLKIKNMTKFAFTKLSCSGVVRVDYLLNSDTDELFINEINSIPGSLANFLFPKHTFTTLLDKMIELAEEKHQQKQDCSFTYDSNVLAKFGETNLGAKLKIRTNV
ncbi:MAG: D-alanine--D-alanine ligase [Clostridia bacterium]|nr:D-alanine--D-alanine ligase [Clostridia bacterium]